VSRMLAFSLPPNTDIVAAILALVGIASGVLGWLVMQHQRRITAIRDLLRFLEDKRVLYNPMAFEGEDDSVHSVLEIRAELRLAGRPFRDGDVVMPHLSGLQGPAMRS
jgi:hypothetical protein